MLRWDYREERAEAGGCVRRLSQEREAGGLGQDNSRAWTGESGQILDRSYLIMKIFKPCKSRESDTENSHKFITQIQ